MLYKLYTIVWNNAKQLEYHIWWNIEGFHNKYHEKIWVNHGAAESSCMKRTTKQHRDEQWWTSDRAFKTVTEFGPPIWSRSSIHSKPSEYFRMAAWPTSKQCDERSIFTTSTRGSVWVYTFHTLQTQHDSNCLKLPIRQEFVASIFAWASSNHRTSGTQRLVLHRRDQIYISPTSTHFHILHHLVAGCPLPKC